MSKLKKKKDGKKKTVKKSEVKFDPNMVPNTEPDPDRDQLLTDIGPCKIGWSTCGRCREHYTRCECSRGVIHPSSVEWPIITNRLRESGQIGPHEGQLTRDDPRVQSVGIYWYAPKRASKPGPKPAKHAPRSNTSIPAEPKRIGKVSERRTLKKALHDEAEQKRKSGTFMPESKRIKPTKRVETDLKKLEQTAERSQSAKIDDLLASVDKMSKAKKPIKSSGKKPLRKRSR